MESKPPAAKRPRTVAYYQQPQPPPFSVPHSLPTAHSSNNHYYSTPTPNNPPFRQSPFPQQNSAPEVYYTDDPPVKRDPGNGLVPPSMPSPNFGPHILNNLPPSPQVSSCRSQQHLGTPQQIGYDKRQPIFHQFYPHKFPPVTIAAGGTRSNNMTDEISMNTMKHKVRRKAQRASQACETCRRLKAKCDEQKPCKSCIRNQQECTYTESPPKPDKMEEMLAKLFSLQTECKDELRKIHERLRNNPSSTDTGNDGIPGLSANFKQCFDTGTEASETRLSWSPEKPVVEFELTIEQAWEVMERMDDGTKDALESRIAAATTSFLQQWPSIHTMVQNLLPGQREESQVPRKNRGTFPALLLSVTCPDTRGHVSASTPPPGINSRSCFHLDENHNWDWGTTWNYVQSFKENVLSVYPIIVLEKLDAVVTAFFCDPRTAQISRETRIGNKRKRSSVECEPNYSPSFQTDPLRNATKAFIMLVLALGKFCLLQGKFPDACDSPSTQHGIRSSVGSPWFPSLSNTWGLPSPEEGEHEASRLPSLSGAVPVDQSTCSHRRNFGRVPGIEYFDIAMELIGDQLGAYTLEHVQVYILASLYYGQLGCVQESWSYISLASGRLQVIMEPSLNHLESLARQGFPAESREDNLLALAFWTCLQLETDILAGFPFPSSGIREYEKKIPYPNVQFAQEQDFPEHTISSYMAQLYLQKQSNEVCDLLCNPPKVKEADQSDNNLLAALKIQGDLETSRSTWVTPYHQWNDGDPPASDSLSARLRAKYWGLQVMICQSFLQTQLEREMATPNVCQAYQLFYCDASKAVRALVESTQAFNGIKRSQRIILPNVFVTAHEQWKNLLLLAACYQDDILRKYVNADILSILFAKTIAFFQTIPYQTNSLMTEMNILIGLASGLGFASPDA